MLAHKIRILRRNEYIILSMKFQKLLITTLFLLLLISQNIWAKQQSQLPQLPKPQTTIPPPSNSKVQSAKPAERKLNIVIVGINDPEKKNILSALQIVQASLDYPLTPNMVVLFNRRAPEEIKRAIEPFGYFKAQIRANTIYQNRQWTTTFYITPGPQMKITSVDVNITGAGSDDPTFQSILNDFPIKAQQPLDVEKYNQAKQSLIENASERGYFDAQMQVSRLVINLDTYQAQVILHFATGIRYRFGPTSFSQSDFALSFLKRFLKYHEGDYYDYHLLQKTQQDFQRSNFFDQVTITPLTQQTANGYVPIEIQITSRKSKQFTIGGGYGTDTDLRGILGINLRRLNAYGHHFNAYIQASKINSSMVATYAIPGSNPATDQYAITGGLAHINENVGKSNGGQVGVNFTKGLGDYLLQTIALTYLDEHTNYVSFPIPISAQLVYPSIVWQYLYYDNPLSPTRAFVANAQISGTTNKFTSNGQSGFFQTQITARTLLTFLSTRLLLRASVGETAIGSIQNLPLSLQLLAGGPDSIRGFALNSIGPGHTLVVGSFEIQQRVYKSWYIGGFIDAGSVSNSSPFKTLDVGVGPVLVWLSPIGAVGLSLGHPIKAFNQPKQWMVQFNIGPGL